MRARPLSLLLGGALCLATGGLVVLGFLATREWRRNSRVVLERQVEITSHLLSTGLSRDMKGAQVSILLPITPEQVRQEPPHDLRDAFARGFARFPYPEFFFLSPGLGAGEVGGWMFARSEGPPSWITVKPEERRPHTVIMMKDPRALRELWHEVRSRAGSGGRFAVFDWQQGGDPYQVVLQYLAGPPSPGPPAVVGFAVNVRRVREQYFRELLDQVSRLGDSPGSVSLAILDDARNVVAQTGSFAPGLPVREQRFALWYFDRALSSLLPPDQRTPRWWSWRVGAAHDRMLAAADRGARRTFLLLTLAAAASVVGLLLTARAVRVQAELAAMKSDFVSTVTHELKAPLALIQLVGDTLAMGRYSSADAIRDYARLLSQEARRLARLIDNLLTYARVSDVQRLYSFEPLDASELVEDALDRFRPRLAELGFEVGVDVPFDLPRLRGDRVAVLQALDNVLDNAIKYSTAQRRLAVRGRSENDAVRLDVIDRGQGIPEAELPRVFERFYRGRRAGTGGSGLGLAIVRSVVEDHGGRVEVRSRPDEGTTVSLWLPADRA